MSIDEIVTSLANHFDQVTVNPAATPKLLANAQARFPDAPVALTEFWRHCNGIRVGLRDDVVGDIFGIETAIQHYNIWFHDEPELAQFIPLRGDGCGDYDCIVAQHTTAAGCVVFWDHETYSQPSHLLAGTFTSYLSFWCRHVINCYFPDGEKNPQFQPAKLDRFPWFGDAELTDPWPFDEEWLRNNDAHADALLSQPTVRHWLADQDNLR